MTSPSVFWASKCGSAKLIRCSALEPVGIPWNSVMTVFADPPYFLSGKGSTCSAGQRAAVDKGKWDRPTTPEEMHQFNLRWLAAAQMIMHPNGSIIVSGTMHSIHSVGFAMQSLGFRRLNDITWEKPNPPPNLGCRCLTHSTEVLLWSARTAKARHHFDYQAMREENDGKQLKDVWSFTAPGKAERTHGRHPTQKPLDLLRRALRMAAPPGSLVLDPFTGSGTTGVAAIELGLGFVGLEIDERYLELASQRISAALAARAQAADK